MAANPQNIPLALYIHIPWCERKCPYCDFNSHEHFEPHLEGPYIQALLADLKQQLDTSVQRPLTSVFIGGGTPSLFSGAAIGALLEGVDQLWGLGQAEVTLESNPGSAEASRYADYRSAGVNRLSIGVQSFNDDALRQLGRVHNSDQARQAADLAARHFERFNLDLMHGLPGQSVAAAVADLEEAIARSGGHLSWYQLTIEPNTAFWSRPPEIPVEDVLADIQDAGEAVLVNAGFQRYEVSAWCKAGQESRHNLNYWTFGDYIGIGAGAHGKLTRANGQMIRARRSRLPKDYLEGIAANKPPIVEPVAPEDVAGEFILNALRLQQGVPVAVLSTMTGLTAGALEPVLSALRQQGLMVDDPNRLQTTDMGFRFLNEVVARFLDR